MTTIKRKRHTQQVGRITDEAIEAFRSGDELALHRALRLPPWQISPLAAVGECPWPATCGGATSWPDSVALREELEAIA